MSRRVSLPVTFALLSTVTLSRCTCDDNLNSLPVAQIEVLDADGNSHKKADPWLVINLGDADSGVSVATTMTIKDTGTGALDIAQACFVAAADVDAAKTATCLSPSAVPFSLDPTPTGSQIKKGGKLTVGVRFKPTSGGPASVFLQITSNAKDEPVVAVQLTGRGTDGRLCAEPDHVYDFGDVNVGETVPGQLTLRNCGVKPVLIDTFVLERNPDDAFVVLIDGNPPQAPIGPLAENDTIVLELRFTPQQPVSYHDNNSGRISVTTAAPFVAQYTLDLVGIGVVPPSCKINVVPENVNFGAVASNASATRQVIVQSVGQCACTVQGISSPLPVEANFVLGALPALPVTLKGTVGCEDDPADATAAPSNFTFDVVYTSPDRPDPIADNASLTVTSTDLVEPDQEVLLQANGGGEPFCSLQVVPAGGSGFSGQLSGRWGVVEFGRTSVFTTKRLPIQVTNVGNEDCHVNSVRYEKQENTQANEFALENEDGSDGITNTPVTILASETRTYYAVFAPTHTVESNGFFPNFGSYSPNFSPDNAFLCGLTGPNERCNGVTLVTDTDDGLDVTDPNGNGWAQGEFSLGFSATPVEPEVDVIPGELDFGLVTLGCGSPEQRVTAYNTGQADLLIGEPRIEPAQNPARFTIEGTLPAVAPGGQLTIPPGSSFAVLVRYHAQTESLETGSLVIPTFTDATTEGPPVTVPLRGEGTTETEHTDIFDQFSDPKTDVLFIVDDSGSMEPYQQLLADNFDQFFTASQVDQADYHIAVTTTLTADDSCVPAPATCDTSADCGADGPCVFGFCSAGNSVNSCPDDPMSGYYTVGAQGNDRYLSPTSSNPETQFGQNVRVSQTKIPSRSPSDSAEGGFRAAYNFLTPPKVDDPAINGGFLRDDAKLHVIMVSDEPEQSKGPVDLYIDFFKNLKGFRNEGLVAVSAIASPAAGCTFSDGSQLPGDPRYETLVGELNGRFQNICESDWTGMMANLGLDSLGLRIEFLLSRAAEPGNIDVCVRDPAGSATCTPQTETSDGAANGWFFDQAANSVVFNPGSVPPRSSRIEVHYSTFCF